MNLSLTMALRVVATLLILAVALQFFFYNQLLVKTIVVAHIVFFLSLFSEKHIQRVAVVSIALAIVVPIGAWRMVSKGEATYDFFFLNLLIFIFIAYVALKSLKTK